MNCLQPTACAQHLPCVDSPNAMQVGVAQLPSAAALSFQAAAKGIKVPEELLQKIAEAHALNKQSARLLEQVAEMLQQLLLQHSILLCDFSPSGSSASLSRPPCVCTAVRVVCVRPTP